MKKLEFLVSRLCLLGVIVVSRYGYERIWPQPASINPQLKYSIEEQIKRMSPPPAIIPVTTLKAPKPIVTGTTVMPNYSYSIEYATHTMKRLTSMSSFEIDNK